MRLKIISEKKGCCPSCGKKFPKDEPYPDVENCETCERFGPPKDIKESEYDNLEDADEFGSACPICKKSFDIDDLVHCGSCDNTICYDCVQSLFKRAGWQYNRRTDSFCPECLGRHNNRLTESEYDELEDADEFDTGCDNCGIPLGGDGYRCDGCRAVYFCLACADVMEDPSGQLIVCPTCRQSDAYADMIGHQGPQHFQESSEYDELEDADEFEEEQQYHPFLNQLQYKFLGSRWPSYEVVHWRPTESDGNDHYYIEGNRVFKNLPVIEPPIFRPKYKEYQIGYMGDPVPFPELIWGHGIPVGHERWTWHELLDQLHGWFGPEQHDDLPPGVGVDPIEESEYDELEDADKFGSDSRQYVIVTQSSNRQILNHNKLVERLVTLFTDYNFSSGNDDYQASFELNDSGNNPPWVAGYLDTDYYLSRSVVYKGEGIKVEVLHDAAEAE